MKLAKKFNMTAEVLFLLGLLLIIFPTNAKYVIVYFFGTLCIVQGILFLIDCFKIKISAYLYIFPILLFTIGAFFLFFPTLVLSFVMFLIGVLFLFWSLVDLIKGYSEIRLKHKDAWISLLSGAFLFITSIFCFIIPGSTSDWMIRILGILLNLFSLTNGMKLFPSKKKAMHKEEKTYIDAEIVNEEEVND